MSSIFINRAGISRTLSTRLAAPNDLDAFAKGLMETYLPKTTSDYWTYRRYLHDILCLALLDVGLYKNEEFKLEHIGLQSNSRKLNQQKPDLYTLELRTLDIGEVLTSYNVEPERNKKLTKYNELFEYIHSETELTVNYSVICLDLTDPEWETGLPTLPELHKKMLDSFILNLRFIHANSKFASYRTETADFEVLDKFRFELDPEDVSKMFKKITKSQIELPEILERIEGRGEENLSDEMYLSMLAQGILDGKMNRRPYPHPEPLSTTPLLKSWEKFKSTPRTTTKLPRILQLGAPAEIREHNIKFEELVRSIKTTTYHGGYLDMVKTYLAHSDPDENRFIHLSLSESQLHKEQLEGPGRKAALKRLGMKVDRKPPVHISIDESHMVALEDLVQTTEDVITECRIKEIQRPDLEVVGAPMYKAMDELMDLCDACPLSGIAKFYQKASQEIVINSMRRRKNRQYVLCDSGFEGIFILIAPGPQLRTESNVEFVKFVSLVRPLYHELSAPWLSVGDHWESEWLSVDTDRLKHWARAYDRIVMANLCCAERLVEQGKTIVESLREEIKYGNFQLAALTYLEDKQLTSLTNQTIRYLWMKALGDKQFEGIMSKFPTRVNSVIQSTMLQRAMAATKLLCEHHLSEFVKLPKARQDDQTGIYDESTTGVLGKLPRLITKGNFVPVSYNLNEIYWCMMYNKDRQNPAQDALSILDKVLKEEEKFNLELLDRKGESGRKDYVFGNGTVFDDIRHVKSNKPESHYFSRRAVQLGIKLQESHVDNVAPDHTWRTAYRMNAILSKNLSEFATFKASVKDICHHVDPSDLRELEKVGSRTKAVELVAEIAQSEKLMSAYEVAMQFSGQGNRAFDVMIQIFKKGQIGGVREIMILYIKARILFNIVEEVCRLLSKSDKREILTKGKDKRLMMRGDYEEVLSMFDKGTPVQMVKNSYDMTTWAQKFIPTIFCSIYTKLFEDLPSLKNLSYFIFLKHTNKMIEYPRKLTEMWVKHPKEKHEASWLQEAKEKFLRDGIPYFRNHSNMCQGIPHYNSTVLALSCQSLRDALFEECLEQLEQEKAIHWKTRVGSDDKGDMIGINMSKPYGYSQYLLFEQCAHAAERLHSMELSVKSAAGNIIYELNSAFMANLETLSPTVKFGLASCDMISTTSCSIFVNEAYGRIRQLRENGGSSVLCGIAHLLNMEHFKVMFRTGAGMTNDIRKITNADYEDIPYDFGVYPFYDVDLQEIVGPEFHNYLAMTSDTCPRELKQMLYTPLSKETLDEAFPGEDEGLLKKDHFGIRQGLIKQLVGMRRRLGVEAETVEKFFDDNPFLIVRGPETVEETIKVIQSKLLTKGASEALRRTSPAIYLGRLSAFESARAWKMRKPTGVQSVDLEQGILEDVEEEVPVTYLEFMSWGLERAKKMNFPVEAMLSVIFPQRQSFEVIKQFVGKFGLKRENLKTHSQAVRHWVVNSYNYNFSNSLKSILETSFGLSQLSSKEDVAEFKKMLGYNLSSYESFIEECRSKRVRPLDMFFYMSKIYKASKSSKIQAFASGPSTTTLHGTLTSLKRFSHLPNHEMVIDMGLDPEKFEEENRIDIGLERLKFACNLLLMESQEALSGPVPILEGCLLGNSTFASYCETTIRSLKSISGMDHQTKKIIIFVASQVLPKNEFKDKLLAWKNLNFTYLRRQKKTIDERGSVSWSGDLEMLVNAGSNTFTVNILGDKCFLRASRIEDTETLLRSLKDLAGILNIDFHNFFTNRPLKPGCYFLGPNTKTLMQSTHKGPACSVLNLNIDRNFHHLRLQDLDSFLVSTKANKKTGAVYVELEQRGQRTATICHFPGNYYPTTKPRGLQVPEEFWFKGVRFTRILQNEDWFFNYRLPSMSDQTCTDFFREDVNFAIVLQQTTSDKGRIVDYLQVMDEVNEEIFSLHNTTMPLTGTLVTLNDFDDLEGKNVNDLFAQEILKIKEEGVFTFAPIESFQGMSWADMVEEDEGEETLKLKAEAEGEYEAFEEALNEEEDGIKFVRSMGYKRRARRANFQVISLLQQGHLLKERILNLFFKNGSVTSEDRKMLPHYYVWVRDHKLELPSDLGDELTRLILTELRIVMGATEHELRHTLDRASSRLGTAPPKLTNFLYSEGPDLFSQLSQTVAYEQSRYEESEQADEY